MKSIVVEDPLELVENEERYENKKMKSIVVEEQEQGESESETGFVDLDEDTLHNVLKRVDAITLGRAACVNKLWRNVAWDDRLWELIFIRHWAISGQLKNIDIYRNSIRWTGFRKAFHIVILPQVAKPPPSDFYSIDPQVFSSQIRPWRTSFPLISGMFAGFDD